MFGALAPRRRPVSGRPLAVVLVVGLAVSGLSAAVATNAFAVTLTNGCAPGPVIKLANGKSYLRGICDNKLGAYLYAAPQLGAKAVSQLATTKSWFACGIRDTFGRGWLYTEGDPMPGGLPVAWGWMPAVMTSKSKDGYTPGVADCNYPNGDTPAAGASGGTDVHDVWWKLAKCESGVDPLKNTGNGYYGAFQFSDSTWKSIGGPGAHASDASYAVQKQMAQKLQARSGWGQWPTCSKQAGAR